MSFVANAFPTTRASRPAVSRWHDVQDFCPATRVGPGRTLIHRGEAHDHLWVIEEGELEVRVGRGADALVVGHLGEGDHVGALGMLGLTHTSVAEVVTRGACVLRRLDLPTFHRLEATGSRSVARIEYDSVRALVAHRDAALHALSSQGGSQPPPPSDDPPAPSLPHLLAWPLGLSLRALGDLPARSVAPGQRLGELRLGEQRPGDLGAGRGPGPGAWLVLDGSLQQLRVSRRGGLLGSRSVLPGMVAGAEHALNLATTPWAAVAPQGASLAWLGFDLLLRSMVAPSGGPRALRRALLNSLALDVDDATRSVARAHVGGGGSTLDLDQERMLRVAHRASAGGL